jgi:hypothetical protein
MANNRAECVECGLPTGERVNYFTGQFLAERDFRAEQSYHVGKHRQHNRYLHGCGTVCGLRVRQHPNPDCRDRFVVIEPGLALDCCGREVVVDEPVYVDLPKYLAAIEKEKAGDGTEKRTRSLLISLCYSECKTEFVPALYSECGCDERVCEAGRVREGFEVKVELADKLPENGCGCCGGPDAVDANLEWTTTLNLDKAARLALDAANGRLYVLTSADAGQVMVFDADHHCLLRTIDLGARGAEIALSADGQELYVICYAGGKYSLRVVGVQKLDAVQTFCEFGLSSVQFDAASAPKLLVSQTDGRVFTLDPNAPPAERLTIWTTDINTPGAHNSSVIYLQTEVKDKVLDLAISPDGAWLFGAQDSPQKNVYADKIATAKDQNPVACQLQMSDTPTLLAVSGDSQRLFVLTADKKLHAFRVQETPAPFPEMGGGVDVGADEIVAMQSSPSGKWVYLLSRDAAGKSSVRAVSVYDLENEPDKAVGPPASVVSGGLDLVASADGRVLYAAGEGGGAGECGGVSVLEVNEEACAEIFWRALDCCPRCGEDACLPLAAVRDYTQGQSVTDALIDNRIRPLVPSTETLRKAILCALESGGGKQGPEGPAGKDGNDGQKGDTGPQGPAGPGLEAGLTRITALSWRHDTDSNPLIDYQSKKGERMQAVAVGFSKPVNGEFSKLAGLHIFRVLAPRAQETSALFCFCQLVGLLVPIDIVQKTEVPPNSNQFLIKKIKPANDPTKAWGLAVVFSEKELPFIRNANMLRVELNGDFVLDTDGRAIDAEFVRAKLPTGDRPEGSDVGIQGGIFESWFMIHKTGESRSDEEGKTTQGKKTKG